jgi:hypothetical protein
MQFFLNHLAESSRSQSCRRVFRAAFSEGATEKRCSSREVTCEVMRSLFRRQSRRQSRRRRRPNGPRYVINKNFQIPNRQLVRMAVWGKTSSQSLLLHFFSLSGTHVLSRGGGQPLPGGRSNNAEEDDDEEEEDDEKREERETIIDRDVILVSCDDERRVGSFEAREFESFRVARRHPVNASQK